MGWGAHQLILLRYFTIPFGLFPVLPSLIGLSHPMDHYFFFLGPLVYLLVFRNRIRVILKKKKKSPGYCRNVCIIYMVNLYTLRSPLCHSDQVPLPYACLERKVTCKVSSTARLYVIVNARDPQQVTYYY
jgi:hypothetical protein